MPNPNAEELLVLLRGQTDVESIPVALQSIQQGINDVMASAGNLTPALDGTSGSLDNIARGAALSGSALQSMTSSASLLSSIMQGLGAAFGGFLVQATMAASRLDELTLVLHQVAANAGIAAEAVDRNVQAARNLGIAQQEATQFMTQAIRAGIQYNDALKLMRLAQDAAVAGGMNSSQAAMMLMHGIVTRQTEVLRMLGIDITFDQRVTKSISEVDRARILSAEQSMKAAGKTSAEIKTYQTEALAALKQGGTGQVSVQQTVNEVLKQGEKIAGSYELAMTNAYKQIQSMTRYLSDITVNFGRVWEPVLGLVVTGITDILKGLRDLPQGVTNVISLGMGLLAVTSGLRGIAGILGIVLNLIPGMAAFGPILAVIAPWLPLIMAGLLGIVSAIKWLTTEFNNTDSALRARLLPAVTWLQDTFKTLGDLLGWHVREIWLLLQRVWERLQLTLRNLSTALNEHLGIMNLVGIVWSFFKDAVTAAMDIINNALLGLEALLSGDWHGAWNFFVEAGTTALALLGDFVVNFIGAAATWGWNLVVSLANGIVEAATQILPTALESVGNMIASYLEGHSPPEKGPLMGIVEWGVNVAKAYGEGMQSQGETIARSFANAISEAMPGAGSYSGVNSVIAGVVPDIGNLTGLFDAASQATIDYTTAVGQGFNIYAADVQAQIKSLTDIMSTNLNPAVLTHLKNAVADAQDMVTEADRRYQEAQSDRERYGLTIQTYEEINAKALKAQAQEKLNLAQAELDAEERKWRILNELLGLLKKEGTALAAADSGGAMPSRAVKKAAEAKLPKLPAATLAAEAAKELGLMPKMAEAFSYANSRVHVFMTENLATIHTMLATAGKGFRDMWAANPLTRAIGTDLAAAFRTVSDFVTLVQARFQRLFFLVLQPLFNAMGATGTNLWDNIKQTLYNVETALNLFWLRIRAGFWTAFVGVWQVITAPFIAAWELFRGSLTLILDILTGDFFRLGSDWDAMVAGFNRSAVRMNEGLAAIGTAFVHAWNNYIWPEIKTWPDKFIYWMTGPGQVLDRAKTTAAQLGTLFVIGLQSSWQLIVAELGGWANGFWFWLVGSEAVDIGGGLTALYPGAFRNMQMWGAGVIAGLQDTWRKIVVELGGWANGIWGWLAGEQVGVTGSGVPIAATGAIGRIRQWGNGIIAGLQETWLRITVELSQWATGIWGWLAGKQVGVTGSGVPIVSGGARGYMLSFGQNIVDGLVAAWDLIWSYLSTWAHSFWDWFFVPQSPALADPAGAKEYMRLFALNIVLGLQAGWVWIEAELSTWAHKFWLWMAGGEVAASGQAGAMGYTTHQLGWIENIVKTLQADATWEPIRIVLQAKGVEFLTWLVGEKSEAGVAGKPGLTTFAPGIFGQLADELKAYSSDQKNFDIFRTAGSSIVAGIRRAIEEATKLVTPQGTKATGYDLGSTAAQEAFVAELVAEAQRQQAAITATRQAFGGIFRPEKASTDKGGPSAGEQLVAELVNQIKEAIPALKEVIKGAGTAFLTALLDGMFPAETRSVLGNTLVDLLLAPDMNHLKTKATEFWTALHAALPDSYFINLVFGQTKPGQSPTGPGDLTTIDWAALSAAIVGLTLVVGKLVGGGGGSLLPLTAEMVVGNITATTLVITGAVVGGGGVAAGAGGIKEIFSQGGSSILGVAAGGLPFAISAAVAGGIVILAKKVEEGYKAQLPANPRPEDVYPENVLPYINARGQYGQSPQGSSFYYGASPQYGSYQYQRAGTQSYSNLDLGFPSGPGSAPGLAGLLQILGIAGGAVGTGFGSGGGQNMPMPMILNQNYPSVRGPGGENVTTVGGATSQAGPGQGGLGGIIPLLQQLVKMFSTDLPAAMTIFKAAYDNLLSGEAGSGVAAPNAQSGNNAPAGAEAGNATAGGGSASFSGLLTTMQNILTIVQSALPTALTALGGSFATIITGILGSLDLLIKSLSDANVQIERFKGFWESLVSKTITLTVEYDYQGEGPKYAATGLDFTVPAGHPNDSYPFMAMLTSGEQVVITPATKAKQSLTSYYATDAYANFNSTLASIGTAVADWAIPTTDQTKSLAKKLAELGSSLGAGGSTVASTALSAIGAFVLALTDQAKVRAGLKKSQPSEGEGNWTPEASRYHYSDAGSKYGSRPGYATGATLTVPSGFSGDTFPFLANLSSGENVTVIPRGANDKIKSVVPAGEDTAQAYATAFEAIPGLLKSFKGGVPTPALAKSLGSSLSQIGSTLTAAGLLSTGNILTRLANYVTLAASWAFFPPSTNKGGSEGDWIDPNKGKPNATIGDWSDAGVRNYYSQKHTFGKGGAFVVPPGFANDSYPMWVESGELVQVTPKNLVGNPTIALGMPSLTSPFYMLDKVLDRLADVSGNKMTIQITNKSAAPIDTTVDTGGELNHWSVSTVV